MPHETEYYDTLGISPSSSTEDIKKAYKKKAIKHHPDKGGNKEEFQKITEAYEILSDPEKKEKYDKHGKAGLASTQGFPSGFPDVFSQMFGGGHPFFNTSAPQARMVTPDINYTLKLSLHDIYFGKSIKLKLKRNVLCIECNATGNKDKVVIPCGMCKGKKTINIIRQQGSMIVQQTMQCGDCGGRGRKVSKDPSASLDNCQVCQGSCLLEREDKIEFDVPRGIKNGEVIKFPKRASENIDCETGDLNIKIHELPHDKFKRDGNNLYLVEDILLLDALAGKDIFIDHIDEKKKVTLKIEGVINHGEVKEFDDMGMICGKEIGKLFIKFNVIFPKTIDKEKIKYLRKGLN